VGNHEYGTSDAAGCGYACGYFDYFNGIGQAFGRAGERNKGYYAVDVGAWRLYAMNSNCSRKGAPGCGPGSAQLRFLEEDLAAHPRRCSLMFMHHPLFTSDTRDFDSEAFRTLLRPLWQAFYDHGGDVVLTGHTHFYERYAPQNPQGQLDPARGIREFIVGTGGRNVYSAGTPEANSEVRVEKTVGVIKMTLRASSYDWQFVPEPGKTLTDSGTQRCHCHQPNSVHPGVRAAVSVTR
jgi:3',5'-cyclic AMP phosphodiesterase CpdA